MALKSVNPASGETLAVYDAHSEAEVDAALARSTKAFNAGRGEKFEPRADRMRKAAGILEARKAEFAALMTAEMGKPIVEARAEIDKCALVCRYYADNAESFLADEAFETDKGDSYVRNLPLGPILAVMPWNFPFWQVLRFAAPNLMAGNTGLLKHASNVTGSALALESVFREAGFPESAFQVLKIAAKDVERVIRDDRVRGVTLTGSEKAGAAVAKAAGEVIKKSVLELGGSDAFIVMPSADLEQAAKIGVKARMQNNGQSCIAAKRFFLHADIYDEYRDAFLAELATWTVGDPAREETRIGPVVSTDASMTLDSQVRDSIAAGASRLIGAAPMEGPGAFFEPGVLEDIPAQSPAAVEEIFGPVALFFRVRTLGEAVETANSHRYGLGSAVWTTDKHEIAQAVNGLEAGATYVNQMVASDPRLPFGGVKRSGYGRELSKAGLLEFVNRKSVAIK